MKMHSYITLNWQLQSVTEQSRDLFDSLKEKTNAFGGWDKSVIDAIARKAELQLQASSTHASSTHEPTPIGTPPVTEGFSTATIDVSTASALRQRLNAMASLPNNGNQSSPRREGVDAVHSLIHHPDSEISAMAKDYSELQSELTSSGPHHVTWPNSISWKNFAIYQLIPTLVYDLEYPRTDR
jgi:sterol O-acyltransferase